jgi:hypothetical protein
VLFHLRFDDDAGPILRACVLWVLRR